MRSRASRRIELLRPLRRESQLGPLSAPEHAWLKAALEAGLEPPEYKAWDTSIKAAERERKRQEWKAGIDQRRKVAIDKWNAEHPEEPIEFKPFLTWGEEHDLKLAQMKKLKEEEEARLRGEDVPLVSPELPAESRF